jgi:iron-sulfur cluster assembly protein
MVTLTQAAVATLEQVIARSGGVAKGLRLAVTDGGCAGHKYQMGLEAEANDGDTVLSFGDVSIFVDANSGPLLSGVVVDYVEGIEGSGFKFDNPNATSSCGCGKSFPSGEGSGSSCSSTPGSSSGGCGTGGGFGDHDHHH